MMFACKFFVIFIISMFFLFFFLFCFSTQICLIVHYLYDNNMAVLLYVSCKRTCNTPELHARLLDTDFVSCCVDNIHQFLQSLHDDVFRCLRAFVYSIVFKLALLRWDFIECFGKLFNLHNLHYLHLHGDSLEALSMLNHGVVVFDSIWSVVVYAQRQILLSWSDGIPWHQNLQDHRHSNNASRVRSHYFVSHAVDVICSYAWDIYKSWPESFGSSATWAGEAVERKNDYKYDAKSCCWFTVERNAKRLWAFNSSASTVNVRF